MPEIRAEILAFVSSIISGCVVRIIYQCLTCFRNIVKHRNVFIEIEDFLFWAGTAVYLFVQIYYTSSGVVRGYFVLGIVLGGCVATIFVRKIKKNLKKIYDFHAGKNIAENSKKRYYNKY